MKFVSTLALVFVVCFAMAAGAPQVEVHNDHSEHHSEHHTDHAGQSPMHHGSGAGPEPEPEPTHGTEHNMHGTEPTGEPEPEPEPEHNVNNETSETGMEHVAEYKKSNHMKSENISEHGEHGHPEPEPEPEPESEPEPEAAPKAEHGKPMKPVEEHVEKEQSENDLKAEQSDNLREHEVSHDVPQPSRQHHESGQKRSGSSVIYTTPAMLVSMIISLRFM